MTHTIVSPNRQYQIDLDLLPAYNFALQQNGISFIQHIQIENRSEEALHDTELKLLSTSELIVPFSEAIDTIPSGGNVELRDVALTVDGAQLAKMTERYTGNLRIQLIHGEENLIDSIIPVTILAYDEWQGSEVYPELLSAFVMPNNPEIVPIISRASELLGNWTGDPSFDAYQSKDPNRVLKQAAAIYESIKREAVTYCVAPASFESVGQRIRLSDAIAAQKVGNCLDLSLLYAASLEAAGLHPLLILMKSHAFAGLWLEEKTYPDAAFDDASLVTSLFADGVGEVTVVECTAMVNGNDSSFDQAISIAKEHFYEESGIACVIDIRRSRLSKVRPIPRRVLTEAGWKAERSDPGHILIAAAPADLKPIVELDDNAQAEISKKSLWERKLLDLGLRNSLINMRTRSVIPFLSESVDELENALALGKELSVLPRPAAIKAANDKFETINLIGGLGPLLTEELKNNRVHAIYPEGELNIALKNLYRSAKTALEESGANTLYLAAGLLKWFETARSTKARYAPLIMIPVEMVRKSAASGYVIRIREEEPRINITLLEKLKQDYKLTIGGLDPLPLDDAGIDTRKVFTIIRKAVMEMKNWDVLESAYLGNFSFTQFVMWNDLRNRSDDLEKNLIVKSLIDGKLAWEAEEMSIGRDLDESSVLLPLPADASQLYAIDSACKGKSFILHGPPGTGKSQTITALIANALANGKRVLFVAEKMAALEVVQRRLNEIGIGEFCMELHSNKSVKRTVLDRLRLASEVTKTVSHEEFLRKADRIRAVRDELQKYTSALHEKQASGLSVFNLINLYEENEKAPDIARFSPEFIREVTPVTLDEQKLLVSRLIAAAEAVGHPENHPLSAIGEAHYSQDLRFVLPDIMAEYEKALKNFSEQSGLLSAEIPALDFSSEGSCLSAVEIAGQLSMWSAFPVKWANDPEPYSHLEDISELCRHSELAEKDCAALSEAWSMDFLELSGKDLLLEYRTNEAKWGPIKLICQQKLAKRLAPYAKKQLKAAVLEDALLCLSEYQREERAAKPLREKYSYETALCREAGKTDWEKLSNLCQDAKAVSLKLRELSGSEDIRLKYCVSSEIQEKAKQVSAAFDRLQTAFDKANAKLKLVFAGKAWLSGQLQFCRDFDAHANELKEWMAWNSVSEEAVSAGLNNLAEACRNGLSLKDAASAYRKAFAIAALTDAIDRNPVLSGFSGAVFNDKIRQFKDLDSEMTRLTRQEIRCRLAANTPNMTREAAQSSEIGILQRAIRNGGRGSSIRKLFDQISNLLPRLCPCMLMSPISVAQYLDPSMTPFDIVVFDEASQLPTCKAVGAIARGRSAVIVGDPKQMPPTSFFMSNSIDEENIDLEDLESILDDCLAISMPETHLLWHYRSRHESLISFSNRQFYENKLYTFPSVNDRERKVKLIHVDGVFEHGKTRQNEKEAEAVVSEIIRRYRDPELSKLSIGVVTFNITQQELIDDLLTEAYKKEPELEKWAANEKEPLFIKNLENVQGDERDVILFSVTYGPDESGKVSMNFGPLNREGGWRRLNVAVSRARCEMLVFATITADQIDLNKTGAEGVRALKAFLQFAAGEDRSVSGNAEAAIKETDTGIIEAIRAALKEKGYDTERLVGHSKYRIDIGVIDPDHTETYLLGILLDGDSYSAAKSVRDRELGQISVLEGLGWKLLRVWSMDWWDNPEKEISRILTALERLQREKTKPAVSESSDITEESSRTRFENASQNLNIVTEAEWEENPQPVIEKEWSITVYQKAELETVFVEAAVITDPAYYRRIVDRMKCVIQSEAPICEKLLFRRVAQSFGLSRVGSRIQEYFERIAHDLPFKTAEDGGQLFYWPFPADPSSYFAIRRNGDADNARDIREIHTGERVNALCYVLDCQISLAKEDLLKEAAKVMNFTRMGVNVMDAFSSAVLCAMKQKLVELDQNEHYRLTAAGADHVRRAKEA